MTVLICHCCRTPDRIVFDHLIVALVHGSGYEGIATPGCSDHTLRRRRTEWASAGHGPMLWCAKDGEEFQSLDATALPLGIMEDYMGDEIGPLQLDVSGMLIVTSDGIFEAPNAKDEQFGIERVIETLKQYQGASTIEISSAIRDAVTKWQRNPDKPVDDQTTVIIRRVATGLNVTIVEDKTTVAAV